MIMVYLEGKTGSNAARPTASEGKYECIKKVLGKTDVPARFLVPNESNKN